MPIAVRKSLKEKAQLIRLRLPAVSFEAVVDTAQLPKTAHFSQALKTSSLMSASIFGRDNNSDSDMHTSPIFTTCIVVLTAVLIAAGILIYRILFPAIISYPWDMPGEKSRQRKREKKMAVVFAGSFNPPHWGHLVMIRYLVERYVK